MAHYVTNALVKYHKMIDKMIWKFDNQFHASSYIHVRWTLSVGNVYIWVWCFYVFFFFHVICVIEF
jgi:hypothetical protein